MIENLIKKNLKKFQFECCGIDGPKDYEKSVWRAQKMNGPNSNVSRTCCLLQNKLEDQAHINPRPVNDSLCQSSNSMENLVFRNQNVSNDSTTF
jgi:hypothetical protein